MLCGVFYFNKGHHLVPVSFDESRHGEHKDGDFFYPESLVADLHFSISMIAKEVGTDERLFHAPLFLLHPIASLVGDVMVLLEDVLKKKSARSQSRTSDRMNLSDLMQRRQEKDICEITEEGHFEPNEDSIGRLMVMGFHRERALDALESTRSTALNLLWTTLCRTIHRVPLQLHAVKKNEKVHAFEWN
jgi:hypothetical protein